MLRGWGFPHSRVRYSVATTHGGNSNKLGKEKTKDKCMVMIILSLRIISSIQCSVNQSWFSVLQVPVLQFSAVPSLCPGEAGESPLLA